MRLRAVTILLATAWFTRAPLQAADVKATASQLYDEAQREEKAGHAMRAYLLYAKAALKALDRPEYWEKARSLEPAGAAQPEKAAESDATPTAPPDADPAASVVGSISDQELAEVRRLLPPPELKPKTGPRDFDLRGNSRDLIEKAAREFGIEAIFDSGYQPKEGLRLKLTEASFQDTFRTLQAMSDSFVVPISASQFVIANDNPQKRTELDRTAAVTFPIPEPFSIQEVQEIASGVRGTLDIQRLMVDSSRRLILIRDRVSKVRLASKLISDLMRPKPEVSIEVELLAADESSSLTYGLSLPTSIPLVWFGQGRSLSATYPSGYSNYLGFGGGKSFLGLGITSGSLFANASRTTSRTVLRSEIVTSDGQAATLHVGDKYPVQTSGYLGTTTGTGTTYTPPPSINFEDLGLILKITPRVHGVDDVTLEVEAEFKLLGSSSVDGIPVISARKYQSKVRVTLGEWAVLAGLMTDSDSNTISGIPGLAAIPLLRNNSKGKSHGETLIILKPHLLNMPPTETATTSAWVGTETKPRPAI